MLQERWKEQEAPGFDKMQSPPRRALSAKSSSVLLMTQDGRKINSMQTLSYLLSNVAVCATKYHEPDTAEKKEKRPFIHLQYLVRSPGYEGDVALQ